MKMSLQPRPMDFNETWSAHLLSSFNAIFTADHRTLRLNGTLLYTYLALSRTLSLYCFD